MFVSIPPDPAPAPDADAIISNDGFFHDIDPGIVRAEVRATSSITPARLRAAIIAAILTVELDLRDWVIDRLAEGYDSLAAVPAPHIGGESVQLHRYRRAVALYAKAELIDRHRDFDTTAAGADQAEELTPSIAELRRDAQHAVRDIKGQGRMVVDLL